MDQFPAQYSAQPSVCCVVLNWNGWGDTINCLSSLSESVDVDLRILVVDNGSSDDSVYRIRNAFPSIDLIEAGVNLGFAAGNNLGIQAALDQNIQYVWLLNNDTTVTPGTLRSLVNSAEDDPMLGQVGSQLFYMDSRDQIQAWGGGRVNMWTGRTRHFLEPVDSKRLDYLTAASVLVPASIFRKVGLLNEKYFMYWEDTDLSYRIRAGGWRLGVAPGAVVYHKESASTSGNSPTLDRYMTASGVLFLLQFSRFPLLSIAIMVLARAAKRFFHWEWKRGWAVIAGVADHRKVVSAAN